MSLGKALQDLSSEKNDLDDVPNELHEIYKCCSQLSKKFSIGFYFVETEKKLYYLFTNRFGVIKDTYTGLDEHVFKQIESMETPEKIYQSKNLHVYIALHKNLTLLQVTDIANQIKKSIEEKQ